MSTLQVVNPSDLPQIRALQEDLGVSWRLTHYVHVTSVQTLWKMTCVFDSFGATVDKQFNLFITSLPIHKNGVQVPLQRVVRSKRAMHEVSEQHVVSSL